MGLERPNPSSSLLTREAVLLFSHWSSVMAYECGNPHCFYCASLLGLDDVVFRDRWHSEIGDLALVAFCPSCDEPMMVWEDERPDTVVKHGSLQKKLPI